MGRTLFNFFANNPTLFWKVKCEFCGKSFKNEQVLGHHNIYCTTPKVPTHSSIYLSEPNWSNGGWLSRRCSRPANRPCAFVIIPSLKSIYLSIYLSILTGLNNSVLSFLKILNCALFRIFAFIRLRLDTFIYRLNTSRSIYLLFNLDKVLEVSVLKVFNKPKG